VVLSRAIRSAGSENLGPVERTARAFRQDAWAAMRGDIVRALVEYVTNADDAYARKKMKGRILVEVEHKRGDEPWEARVRDRASGMTLAEMKERIGKQGVRASGFEAGEAVRGNLGLGSKDPACFGQVRFDSIKDGMYAWFTIDDEGDRAAVSKPIKATKEIRDALGVPANGTVVTITVTQPIINPRHDTLKQRLERHILLRDIVQASDREVYLVHANKPGDKAERLHYPEPKVSERINRKGVELPGYKGATADIMVAEADEPFTDEGPRSATRQSGLLIKGRRGIYESTLFSFEGNQYALAFNGYIRCEDIDRIAAEYDERADKKIPHTLDNPRPIISRQRDGLADDHPLYQAIRRFAEGELAPLIQEREKKIKAKSRQVENARTTKLLSQLAKEAAKFMQEAAEEEEIDLGGVIGKDKPPALAIIPGAIEMPIGTERTVTVMASKEGLEGATDLEVDLTFAPPGVVTCQPERVRLGPSRRRDDVLTGTTKLIAGRTIGGTMLNAQLGARSDDCAIDVVEPTAKPVPVPPAGLEFERSGYRLVLNKPKKIKIRAPLAAYPDGTLMRVTSGVKGIVVLDGGKVELRQRDEALAMEGTIHVEGRIEKETGDLTVTDPSHRSATASATVVRREESGADFEPKLVPEFQGDQRAQWNTDYSELRIMGEHPAVKPYVGDKDKDYPGQDTREFKMLTAELMSDAVVRRILQEKHRDDELDAGSFYVMHNKLMARLLVRAHRVVAANL
jgi:hypothetical protein